MLPTRQLEILHLRRVDGLIADEASRNYGGTMPKWQCQGRRMSALLPQRRGVFYAPSIFHVSLDIVRKETAADRAIAKMTSDNSDAIEPSCPSSGIAYSIHRRCSMWW